LACALNGSYRAFRDDRRKQEIFIKPSVFFCLLFFWAMQKKSEVKTICLAFFGTFCGNDNCFSNHELKNIKLLRE